nr:hypothetical protein [Tanacetum cinerariifolium]
MDDKGANEENDADELYRDVNINLEGQNIQMVDVQTTHVIEDTHVTLTPVNPEGQQQSLSVSSHFVSNMLNPSPDIGIDSIFDSTPWVDVPVMTIAEPPLLSTTTLPSPSIPIISHIIKEQVKVQVSKILPKIEKTVNEQLEAEVLTRSSNSSKTSHAVAADLSELELKKILIDKMESNKSIHKSDEQKNLYKALVDAYECGKLILNTYEDTVTLKRRRNDEDKDEEPFAGSNQGSKRRRAGKEPESTSALKEKTSNTSGATDDQLIKEASQHPYWFQKQAKTLTPDRAWNKTLSATHRHIQPWINNLAKKADSRTSFSEMMDTPVDFLVFVMNRLKVDTLTPELLASPTYELMKGSCKSLVELEFFFEEVYKATTDQLNWNKPKEQQYPHDLLKQKYTTSVTKTKAADYGHIKWIEDLVPRTMWRQVSVSYDKHALWGISHWGHKRQQFYGFMVNRESARDVYSKRRIIAVTELQIVEWHNYKHLDWITVHRDDDKLYKFKEGYFKRLHIQDIKDMLLLLVQGKLTNLMVNKHFAFNVSLRMFTRSIVIQRRVEDLQLGVESYQKKLNLTKPDTDGTLNDVRTALDDRLKDCDEIPKRPTMYLNLWSYKAVRHRYSNPMIQPEPKGSTQGYPLVSVEVLRSILTDLQVTPTKPRRMKNPYSSHRFIANYFNAGNLKMEVKVPGSSCLIDS